MPSKAVLVGLSSFQFFSFLRRAVFYAFFYIYLRTYLGLSNTLAALLGTANFFGSTIGQLKIWGPRLNRQPEKAKKYVVRGEILAGTVYFIVYIGHRFLVDLELKIESAFYLITALSILELFWSMSDLGIRHLIAQTTQKQTRGRTIGVLDSVGLLGQITGFLMSGYLYQDGLGFRDGAIFFVVIILMFSCAVVIQTFVVAQKKEEKDNSSAILSSQGVRDLLRIQSYSFFLLTLLFLVIGMSSSSHIFLYYAEDPTGLNLMDETISLILIGFSLAGGLITPVGGRISDYLGRIPLIVLAGIGAAIGYFLLFFIEKPSIILVGLIYAGLGISSALIQTIAFAHVADLLPVDFRGTGFALFNIILATGWGFAGFLVGGPIADILIAGGQPTTIAYKIDFLVSSLIIIVAVLPLIGFHQIQRKKKEEKLDPRGSRRN